MKNKATKFYSMKPQNKFLKKTSIIAQKILKYPRIFY